MDDRAHNPDDLMENKTAFDLNREIRRWREKLAEAPGFRTDDLDELECHLRESVGDLQGRGLSSEEAFTIAVRRVGPGTTLAAEFGNINYSAIWIDRLLWMLIGTASAAIFQSLFSSVALALTVPNGLRWFLPVLIQVSPLILAILMLRSLVRADGQVSRVMTSLLCRPLRLSLVFFAFGLASIVFRLGAIRYIAGPQVLDPLPGLFVMTVPWIIIALLILYLSDRRVRSVRESGPDRSFTIS